MSRYLLRISNRRFRFGLRPFLLFIALLCVLWGWIGNTALEVLRRRSDVERIRALGGHVGYDFPVGHRITRGQTSPPPGDWPLRLWIQDEYFARVAFILGPEFANGANAAQANRTILSVCRRFPQLQALRLHGPTVDDEHIDQVADLQSLVSLKMSGVDLRAAGANSLQRLPRLRSLELTGSSVTNEVLDSLARIETLQHLRLESTNADPGPLNSLRHFTNLRTLQLQHAAVKDPSLHAALENLVKLESITLIGTPSPVPDGVALKLRQMPALREVRLFNTALSNEGLRHLSKLRTLEVLVISQSNITNSGVAHLRSSLRLRSLTLSGSALTDPALDYVSQIKSLNQLDIRGNFSMWGWTNLARCPNLRSIRGGDSMSKEAELWLERQLGNCTVWSSSHLLGYEESRR